MNDDKQIELIDVAPESDPKQQERDRVREEYRKRLAEKLKDPEFRKIDGFPIGTDEAILALSDPPYYTACPNPYIEEWLTKNAKPYDPETDNYHREPFASDVSEGKNDPIYNAHSYHTKVPHKAIMRYILHYTEPGDVVYDGFCGTGMTGVAAQMCANQTQVEALGYRITTDGSIINEDGTRFSKLGARKALLNDLSPAATFIAYNYNTEVAVHSFQRKAKQLLARIEQECGWLYTTLHEASSDETKLVAEHICACKSLEELKDVCLDAVDKCRSVSRTKATIGSINYSIFSDVLVCPNCGSEIIFWDNALDEKHAKIKEPFTCFDCRSEVSKSQCDRAWTTRYDTSIGQTVRQVKHVPVLINYTVGKKRYEKKPDQFDLALIAKIDEFSIPYMFPFSELPDGYNTSQPKRSHGLTHTHHFYTKRNLWVLSALKRAASNNQELFLLTAIRMFASRNTKVQITKFCRRTGQFFSYVNGTLYVPSINIESCVISSLANRIKTVAKLWDLCAFQLGNTLVETGDAAVPFCRPASIDYIFTDPPFGGNIMYSELNSLSEDWLNVKTNNGTEAITNDVQAKSLLDYQALMARCFAKFYTLLKPGRWMTVEFHNSANAVWNAIQEALQRVGFIVADVRVLDKQQGGFHAVNHAGAVKQDLVISCYKPRHEFEECFAQLQGQPQGVVEFIRQHLAMLPIAPLTTDGKLESVAERTNYLLFDRMVAYHLQRGARIPVSASEFYALLQEEFVERDSMYFLPDQAAKYDTVRVRTDIEPLSLFVKDERSAVQWVRMKLQEESQTLGDLTPKFMQEIQALDNYEALPELRELLKENFIVADDGRWRVPDPDSEKDIEAMRRKALLRVFEGYTTSKGQLKIFRKEAILEGFKHCWQTKQYGIIVGVCEKIPAKILQDIQEFVQFYDIAKDLAPEPQPQLEFTWEA